MKKIALIGSTLIVFINTINLFCPILSIGQDNLRFEIGETIYENPLSDPESLKDVIIESSNEEQPEISFENNRMRLNSDVHFLLWFPYDFPGNIAVSWDFMPKNDDGLAMFWFCSEGRNGADLFDKSLKERNGKYSQYHSGDINAYHLSYFRRNEWDDPYINTVNLRKSYGNKIIAIGPNPIPNMEVEKVVKSMKNPYRIEVLKFEGYIRVKINDLIIINYKDKNPYQGGKIGFRQMANLVAEYSNLRVNQVLGISASQ